MDIDLVSRPIEAGDRMKHPPTPAAAPGQAGSLLRHYRLDVRSVTIGMWVAELDRPWLDTPFLIRGFRVETLQELETLRRYCEFVEVDIEKSDFEVVDAIRRAELAHAGETEDEPDRTPLAARSVPVAEQARVHKGPARPRAREGKVSGGTRVRFRKLVHEASLAADEPAGLRGLLRAFARSIGLAPDPDRMAAERRRRHAALRRSLPIEKPQVYRDTRPIEDELPRARTAFAKSCDTIETLLADIRNERVTDVLRVHAAVDDMVASMIGNPDALMWVARLRDEDITTYSHGVKVALYMIALGRHLGFPKEDLNKLGMIGMLADVGKTRVPSALLEKPGMLTPDEYAIVKAHVGLGLEALGRSMSLPPEVEQGIAQHHERMDGSGYPLGLAGEAIGIHGRIAAIADTFAALITPRVYANACSPQEALMKLFEWSGRSFHAPLVEQFVEAIGIFPVGSLVELSTGEAAIIIAHNRTRRLEPKVLVLTWADKQPLPEPVARDLGQRSRGADGKVIRIVRGLPWGAYGLKVRDYYGRDAATAC
jgi:HD-GYP domain-containing protein (c-di-GMP phosphodiesterase class II)